MAYATLCPICEENWAYRDDEICTECRGAVPDPEAFGD